MIPSEAASMGIGHKSGSKTAVVTKPIRLANMDHAPTAPQNATLGRGRRNPERTYLIEQRFGGDGGYPFHRRVGSEPDVDTQIGERPPQTVERHRSGAATSSVP
jgi:hypothetical protein